MAKKLENYSSDEIKKYLEYWERIAFHTRDPMLRQIAWRRSEEAKKYAERRVSKK